MKIILVCASGMSTTMMAKKIIESGMEAGVDVECSAYGYSVLGNVVNGADCVLIGPQVSYMEEKLKRQYPDIPMAVIPMRDYGMMNGKLVFELAQSIVAK